MNQQFTNNENTQPFQPFVQALSNESFISNAPFSNTIENWIVQLALQAANKDIDQNEISPFKVCTGSPEKLAGIAKANKDKKLIREFFILDEREETMAKYGDIPIVVCTVEVYSESPVRVKIIPYPNVNGKIGDLILEKADKSLLITEEQLRKEEQSRKDNLKTNLSLAGAALSVVAICMYILGASKNSTHTNLPTTTEYSRGLNSTLTRHTKIKNEVQRADRLIKQGTINLSRSNFKFSESDLFRLREDVSSPDKAVALSAIDTYEHVVVTAVKSEGSMLANIEPGEYTKAITDAPEYFKKISLSSPTKDVREAASNASRITYGAMFGK